MYEYQLDSSDPWPAPAVVQGFEGLRAMRLVRLMTDDELLAVVHEIAWNHPRAFVSGVELAGLEEDLMERLDEAEPGWDR